MTEVKLKTISELNQEYEEAVQVDSDLFAEQRSNVLLASGDHYTKKHSKFWSRIRDNAQLNEDLKIRITKNHIHRVCNIYTNNIFSLAPDVGILPHNEKELHDQKVAEQNDSIWKDWKQQVRFREQTRQMIDDFVKVGETCVKIVYNPTGGKVIGEEQATDEFGNPLFDEFGQPVSTGKPVFDGKIELERFFAANLLRSPTSKNIYDGCLIYRKMAKIKDLEIRYAEDEEKLSYVKSQSSNSVYTVFDGANSSINKTKGETMVREFYYPPCEEYRNGYFYIATELGILEHGELPFGVVPIVVEGFDEIPTSPRKRSIIKQLRPPQAELNRAASQMAMHQITIGDDKLLHQSGTKILQSAKLPGIRTFTFAGAPPIHLPGRAGEQFVSTIEMCQKEIYDIANLSEELEQKTTGTVDPFAELFKAIRHKKKYSLYAEKIESMLKRICEIVLIYAKNYYSDERLLAAIGKDERVNLQEFRSQEPLGYDIKLEPQGEDVESKMGKQLTLTSTLQYVGSKLEKEDIGKILRVMPFVNKEEIFSDYTTDYDNATNDILALDRGEYPETDLEENHKYMMKRLTNRMKKADFKFLHPQIQENYKRKRDEHAQADAMQLQLIKQAQSEFIPSGGYLVGVDFYVTNPENPGSPKRAKLPYESVAWLVKQLEAQGTNLAELEKLQQGALTDVARNFLAKSALPQGNGVGGASMPQMPQMGGY